jgi:hypothetical protein
LRTRDTDGLRIKPRGTKDTDGVRVRARDTGAGAKQRDTEGVRSKARDTGDVRSKARETDGLRVKARDTDGVRVKGRDADSLRSKARDADGLRAKVRDTDGARMRTRGHADDTDGSRVGARNGLSMGRGLNASRLGSPAARDRKASVRRGRMADALSGRRRAQDVDAPVDGTAALQIAVDVPAEALKAGDLPKPPQLRVAPPAPISVPRAPFVAAVLGVVVVGVLGILLINTKTNENSFRIADLEKQNAVLDNKKQDLDNQLVQASNVGNLAAAARRLGMVKADKIAVITLPDGKVIGVPTPTDGKVAVTAQDPKSVDPDDEGAAPPDGTGTGAQQPENGATANGATANGAATNGATGNGATTNGAATNGVTENGATGNGVTTNGATTNGQPTLGQNGLGTPGQPTLGQTLPGLTGQGTTGQNQTGQGQSGLGQTNGTGQ